MARPLLLAYLLLFVLAHTQGPVPYSNQNQYLLHGAAQAGVGDLAQDWLANTVDPTPLFSLAVRIGYAFGTGSMTAAYSVLLGVYALLLWLAVRAMVGLPSSWAGQSMVALALIGMHAAALRVASVALFGVDYPWYLQSGVANQYLLGPGVQPSVFGLILLGAIAGFGTVRPAWVAALLALACWWHSTYLLPAALLTLGMGAELYRRGDTKGVVQLGGWALALVFPLVVWILYAFAPVDSARFQESQRILAWIRIPHHTQVSLWLDGIALGQLGIVAAGLLLARRQPVGRALAWAALLALLLSVAQVLTRSAGLALLFPWRISAVLVPLGSATLLAVGIRQSEWFWGKVRAGVWAPLLALVLAFAGVEIMLQGRGYQTSEAEEELIRAVAVQRKPGEVYLLPTSFPKSTRRGAASSTFLPVPPSDRPAIFEMQRFRLGTGAAVYVDFKSVPYHEDDVLEWYRRVRSCEWLYAFPQWGRGIASSLRFEGITHAVFPNSTVQVAPNWPVILRTATYTLYQVPIESP
jgi:hypothetical protein